MLKKCNCCGKTFDDTEIEFFECVSCGEVAICENCQNTAYTSSKYERIDFVCMECQYASFLAAEAEFDF